MKQFLRVFLFILAFQMEVRVRAAADLIQEPAGCLQVKSACVIKATQNSESISLLKGKIFLKEGSILKKSTANDWTFVEGVVWFHRGSGSLKTLFADLKWTSGDFWVESQEGGRLLVRNVSANLSVTLRDGKVLEVPEGFQFWMAGLNSKGASDFGMIQPVEWSPFVRNWVALYPGSQEAFKKELAQLKESWKSLAEVSAQIYKGSVDRQIASIEQAEQTEKRRQEALQAERQKRKELFFRRTFER